MKAKTIEELKADLEYHERVMRVPTCTLPTYNASDEAARAIRAELARREAPKPRPYPELTDRELEVACLLANGDTNREIATALAISIKTVDTHRSHLLKKLGCKNNVALCRLMIRDGVVTP